MNSDELPVRSHHLKPENRLKTQNKNSSAHNEITGQPENPLISIITVVYNGEKFLEQAIQSVMNQNYDSIEHLVIDGGSDDGTVDIIKKYVSHIDYWISEPDEGLYDAMNKGIKQSTGDIIGILNSDDILNPGIIKTIAQTFRAERGLDYIYGSVDRIKMSGEIYARTYSLRADQIGKRKYRQIPFPHPSLYVKKEVFEKLGNYNQQFKLNADYDFILRLLDADFKGKEIKPPIMKFRDGGLSGGVQTFLERRAVWRAHHVPFITRELNVMRSVVKVCLHSVLPGPVVKKIKQYRKNSVRKLQ